MLIASPAFFFVGKVRRKGGWKGRKEES